MKRTILFLCLALGFVCLGTAQKSTKFNIAAGAKDSFNEKSMKNVKVALLTPDSALVDTFRTLTYLIPGNPQYVHLYTLELNTFPANYIVRYQRKGYKTIYQSLTIEEPKKRGTDEDIDLEVVRMARDYTMLREATVSASKIMMVMKGDTMVYNAGAFQLSEGSMLDELIAQLPGVKLEDGGRITVNGHFVSSLLINGRDFFNGDPNVALENLPAYMVDKVKAYQKIPENAYISRKDLDKARPDDPWVIDVQLKKDYAEGWIANTEAGYGTDDRYLGRFFGLRFTDYTSLGVYAATNNLNQSGAPATDSGEWADDMEKTGQQDILKGGIHFKVYGKKRNSSYSTSLTASRTENKLDAYTASTSYLTSGNDYKTSSSTSRSKLTAVSWSNDAVYRGKNFFIELTPNVSYRKTSGDSYLRQAQWHALPVESRRGGALDSVFAAASTTLSDLLVNTLEDRALSESDEWHFGGSTTIDFRLPFLPNSFRLLAWGNYNRKNATVASHYRLNTFTDEAEPDLRNRFDRTPTRYYDVFALLGTTIAEWERGSLTHKVMANYSFRQTFNSGHRSLYRLDSLGGRWTEMQAGTLGMLPSTADSLDAATDWANSFHTTTLERRHLGELSYLLTKGFSYIRITLPLGIVRDRISDYRNKTLKTYTRRAFDFAPSLSISWDNVEFHYDYSRQQPNLLLLLDTRDDSDPLAVRLGNASLKATDTHAFSFGYRHFNAAVQRTWNVSASYVHYVNAVGQSRSFNSTTGGYTYIPRNINGNLTASGNFNYSQALDKKKSWTGRIVTAVKYDRSADFANYDSDETGMAKSIVRNLGWTQTFGADFRRNGYHVGLSLSADWAHATSNREGFQTINTVDWLCRLIGHVPLPWRFEFHTDLNFFCRTGYGDNSMNTDEWVWNASLSRPLDRSKRLILKLSAYDMLGQRSAISRTIDTQGRVETWTNTLTRYVMIHLSYRFSKKPKQHGE